MRVLCCGSRTWTSQAIMEREMAFIKRGDVVVSGNARGADRMAERVAENAGAIVERFPARWDLFGRSAGFRRNIEMLDSGVDMVLAFWDGVSRGTPHTMREAKARNLRVRVIVPTGSFIEFKGNEIVHSTSRALKQMEKVRHG